MDSDISIDLIHVMQYIDARYIMQCMINAALTGGMKKIMILAILFGLGWLLWLLDKENLERIDTPRRDTKPLKLTHSGLHENRK